MTLFPAVCLTIYVRLSVFGDVFEYEVGLHLTERSSTCDSVSPRVF